MKQGRPNSIPLSLRERVRVRVVLHRRPGICRIPDFMFFKFAWYLEIPTWYFFYVKG
jgi:hypothetical protein